MATPFSYLYSDPGTTANYRSRYGNSQDFLHPGVGEFSLSGGSWAGSAQGRPDPATYPTTGQMTGDKPEWDIAAGMVVNERTKRPWTGSLPNGSYVRGGRPANVPDLGQQQQINPNDPGQRFRAVNITKQPDISGATSDLVKSFKSAADSSLKDFGSYLNDFHSNLKTAKGAAAGAENIGPAVSNLETGQAEYSRGLNRDMADYSDLDRRTAASEQGSVAEAKALLPQYNAAGQAIADRQMQLATGQVSRYKMGSGTPTSLGSDELAMMNQAASDIYLPLKRNQINKQYDIINNLELPVTRDIANRETARISQFNPQAQAAIWSSGRATTQDVQNLQMQVRDMSYQDAIRFMQAQGVPSQVQQSILSGQISELAGLSNLESLSSYQGLQDVMGATLTPTVGYSQGTGPYPPPSRYAPHDAPVEVQPSNSPAAPGAPALASQFPGWKPQGTEKMPSGAEIAYYNQTGQWPGQDPHFNSQLYRSLQPQMANSRYSGNSSGSMSNAEYVPGLGIYRDRDTGNTIPVPGEFDRLQSEIFG